ncbi:MAG: sugar phosphate isomerase/epimerase family protein, partial [Anaerolineae bacterium]
GPFERHDDGYLAEVKADADRRGLMLEAGMLSICPTASNFSGERGTAVEQLREMLHIADILGSRIVRCVLGTNADRTGDLPLQAHVDATVATCRAVRDQALDLSIKIAIENHAGDMLGRELRALIEQAGPEYVGACIDTGNPLWVGESPFVTLQHLAPYVLTSHVRDTAVWSHPVGAAVQWMAMGDGTVGIEDWTVALQQACPNVPYSLEIITGAPPRILNYLEPSYWDAYPDTPAAEFVEFLKLVRAGQPPTIPMLTARWEGNPPEYQAALRLQQRLDLERSIRYCREVLSIGERV